MTQIMTEKPDRIASFLKYFNSALITLMTVLLMYGIGAINKMHDSIDDLKIKIEIEATQRLNNSGVILDHETRIRMLEDEMNSHIDDIKDWSDNRYERKK